MGAAVEGLVLLGYTICRMSPYRTDVYHCIGIDIHRCQGTQMYRYTNCAAIQAYRGNDTEVHL